MHVEVFLDSCACEPGQLVYTGVFYWRFLRGKKQCTGKVIRRYSGMSRISKFILQINGTADAVCKQAQEGGQVSEKFSKYSQCLNCIVMTTFKR